MSSSTSAETMETMETTTHKPERPGSPSSNGATGDVDVAAALASVEQASRRRRWPALLAGVVVGGTATWAGLAWFGGGDDTEGVEQEDVSLAVAAVTQQDLLEEIEWSGTLGYGQAVGVAGGGGTITSAAATGTTIQRGGVIADVDGSPVVAFFGDTPLWRTMAEGDEGHDVFQLEANLAALGYDPDGTVDIDGTFTANTELMVERWQEDLGIEATGTVPLGAVVIIEGPSTVVSVGAVGASAQGQLATLAPERAVTDVVASIDGTVTAILPVGSVIEHGDSVYQVDEIEVIALVETDAVSQALTSSTYTVEELEQSLADNGYDPDDEMTVDDTVTDATQAAIERWQSSVGLPVTGQAEPGYYLLVPEGRIVDQVLIDEGTSVLTGGPILTASASRLSVELVVDVAEADEFAVGQTVTVELADESTADGVVADIGSVVQATTAQGSPTVTITVDVFSSADQELLVGPVTVLSIGEAIEGATVVPTRALVTLAEGGFAVEKVGDDGSTTLIGIELGTFDDGVVEVITGDLAPGDDVVVPQ